MTNNLHRRLLHTHSPFAEVSVAAIVVWIGSIMSLLTDLGWLIGDMSVQIHTHHWFVLGGFVASLTVIIASGIWLYHGINRYLVKHEKHLAAKESKPKATDSNYPLCGLKHCSCARRDKLEYLDHARSTKNAEIMTRHNTEWYNKRLASKSGEMK